MSSNKTGMRVSKETTGAELGGTLLKIVGVGIVGGAALIGGAMKLGEAITKKQANDYERLQREREEQNEAVREAFANDYDGYDWEE